MVSGDTLKAYASKPILIINNALDTKSLIISINLSTAGNVNHFCIKAVHFSMKICQRK